MSLCLGGISGNIWGDREIVMWQHNTAIFDFVYEVLTTRSSYPIFNFLDRNTYVSEMENYYKGKNVEEELERDKIPIKDLPDNFLWMQVSA